MNRGRGKFNPFNNRGGGFPQKKKPAFTVPNTNNNGSGSDEEAKAQNQGRSEQLKTTDNTITTEREPGAYVGWKLYFPEKRE